MSAPAETTARGDVVLIVDDEPEILALVSYHLTAAGYETLTAASGAEAIRVARTRRVSLIILDVMLPDRSGFEVLACLREGIPALNIPCLMLSALREDTDRIRGLTIGADDYLTKPFNPDELALRVGAILRRAKSPRLADDVEVIGPVSIDRRGRRVFVDGVDAALTDTEFRLLLTMVDSPGLAQRRDHLLEVVWGAAPDMHTRTVDVHILRLRNKLGAAGDAIETVRGFGYRLSPEKAQPE